jgi:5S rRNA maturation endonuclease (ribonuclease M5)
MTECPPKSKTHTRRPKIVATYDYCDERGHRLYQSVRLEPGRDGGKKDFRQRQPDGSGGWIWNLRGVRRVLYRLPELYEAPRDRLVFVVEGEKDVDRLRAEGLLATTNAMGAGKWCPDYTEALRGRHVVILPDNDEPGRKHARAVAEALKGVAASVKVVELPGLPEKGDVSDWLQIPSNDKTALLKLVEATPQFWPPPESDSDADTDAEDDKDAGQASAAEPDKKAKPTQAEVLLALADIHDFFHSLDGRAYVAVKVVGIPGEHRETFPVRSTGYRQMLARDYYLQTKKAVSSGILQDVLAVLEARALFEGPCREVGIRVMGAGGCLYLDLADERWRAVEVGPAGWKVLDAPPVYFRRSRGMLPLPVPQRGGSLNDLRPLLNLGSEDEWKLSIAWAVQAIRPRGPYPPLGLHGEQGSAKSTRSRLLRGLIDPNVAALRSAPREERDLVIAAHRPLRPAPTKTTIFPWPNPRTLRTHLRTVGLFQRPGRNPGRNAARTIWTLRTITSPPIPVLPKRTTATPGRATTSRSTPHDPRARHPVVERCAACWRPCFTALGCATPSWRICPRTARRPPTASATARRRGEAARESSRRPRNVKKSEVSQHRPARGPVAALQREFNQRKSRDAAS